MAQIETKQTTATFAERFGRVAANGVIGAAALASAFLPMAATAQTVTDVAARQPATHSFTVGQCVTSVQLTAAGQNAVLIVEKMVPVATNRPLIVYTANTRAVGYELVADRPVTLQNNGRFTEPQRPACYTVRKQTLNVRMNDTRTGTVRSDFFQPITNSSLNNSIQVGMRNGVLPALQADTLTQGRRGILITVFNAGDSGFVMSAGPTGLTTRTDTTRTPAITQFSANYYPRGQQVAALSLTAN